MENIFSAMEGSEGDKVRRAVREHIQNMVQYAENDAGFFTHNASECYQLMKSDAAFESMFRADGTEEFAVYAYVVQGAGFGDVDNARKYLESWLGEQAVEGIDDAEAARAYGSMIARELPKMAMEDMAKDGCALQLSVKMQPAPGGKIEPSYSVRAYRDGEFIGSLYAPNQEQAREMIVDGIRSIRNTGDFEPKMNERLRDAARREQEAGPVSLASEARDMRVASESLSIGHRDPSTGRDDR